MSSSSASASVVDKSPSGASVFFSVQSCQTALLDLPRQLRGLFTRRDLASGALGERHFGLVDSGKDFHAAALPAFPQRQSLPEHVFLTVVPAALYRLADKSFLVVRKLGFHGVSFSSVKDKWPTVSNSGFNAGSPWGLPGAEDLVAGLQCQNLEAWDLFEVAQV